MNKQLMIAIVCIMSSATYSIIYTAAQPLGKISNEDVPAGWVEVRWANCEGDDNVKHFKVGTTVESIRMIFSLFKKSPTYFITIAINNNPENDDYEVQKEDYGVATPGIMRKVGGSVVENICYFTGNIIEKYSPTQIKMKQDQNKLETEYQQAKGELESKKRGVREGVREKSQLTIKEMSALSPQAREELMRSLSWKRSAYAELELKMPQEKLTDISTENIMDAYNLVKTRYNSKKDKMSLDDAAAKIEKIQTAYDILSDPTRRSQYDASKMKGW